MNMWSDLSDLSQAAKSKLPFFFKLLIQRKVNYVPRRYTEQKITGKKADRTT
jgi:hypothetical protein